MLFPNFWLKPKLKQSFFTYSLYPMAILWSAVLKLKLITLSQYRSPIPIICVGNITVGGNGKTPTALKLRSLLKELGYKPHILSRGYKANYKGPHRVNHLTDSFLDVGDEALMMAAYGPTWISQNRRSGIKSAVASGANVIILDDGLQNNSIIKDFSILVIETSIGFGNGYLLPAGPLREPISSALEKTDLILTIGETANQDAFQKEFLHLTKIQCVKGRLIPRATNINFKEKKVIAFAGIGHPEKFRKTLEKLAANVITFKAYTNHKPFKTRQLKQLINQAKKHEAILVTTEKDFVRIPKDLKPSCQALTIDLEIENQSLVLSKIVAVL